MSLRESKICFCQINLCSLPIWSLWECKLYGDKRLFTRIGMEKAENTWFYFQLLLYDLPKYHCRLSIGWEWRYALLVLLIYISHTHTWQKHKSETSLSKIAILVDRKTNHYYPNNQTVSSMIPIMLSKTPSPQVLVSQFKPNLHLFTTFWTLVTNLDKLVNVKIQQQYGDIHKS